MKDSPVQNGAIPSKSYFGKVNYSRKNEREKDDRNGIGDSGVEKIYSQRAKTRSQTGVHSPQNRKDRSLKTDDILGALPRIHGGIEAHNYAGVKGLGFLDKTYKTKSSVFSGLIDDTTTR